MSLESNVMHLTWKRKFVILTKLMASNFQRYDITTVTGCSLYVENNKLAYRMCYLLSSPGLTTTKKDWYLKSHWLVSTGWASIYGVHYHIEYCFLMISCNLSAQPLHFTSFCPALFIIMYHLSNTSHAHPSPKTIDYPCWVVILGWTRHMHALSPLCTSLQRILPD